ncbi:MAG: hypothetical protein HKN68_08355 [Saprospiraceae bacterium]|nr:hypothetical protein [Saprospiraceae bacterium]
MGEFDNYIPFILLPLVFWGVRRMLIRKNDYSDLKKWTLGLGLMAWFITEMVRSFIRPYVYQNDIFDFYVSDTIGNSTGTMTAIFMILTLVGKGHEKDFWLILMVVIGLIGYEFMSLASGFDIYDIYATLIFGLISFGWYFLLLQKQEKVTED